MHRIKTITSLGMVLGLALACSLATVNASSWNDAFGMGNPTDDTGFTGTGQALTVVASVQSNTLYYVTSGKLTAGRPLGAARIDNVWLKADTAAANLGLYQPTTEYQVTATGAANLLYIPTNHTISSGDVLVLKAAATDSYQVLIASNTPPGSTNFLVCYQAATNAAVAGDTVYKMTRVASFTPLTMRAITNQVILPYSDWIPMSLSAQPITFHGRRGKPSALLLTYSNAASLFVTGEYAR